ncbi:MAG: transglutaminase domain-containing protein [Candidatus Dojkabacteria bacterium]|jgi:hypothetical protein|nr:transglutaminase domain-containing protein [Candidatus Dojkabacteria bacterium]
MKYTFSKELKELLDSLNTPTKIQQYVDSKIEYDPYREDRTIEEVIKDGKGECYNVALFALAALKNIGYNCGLVLLSPFEDEEHILAVYESNGKWGSIAQSKFLGLKSREPIYLNIHDLATSYKEFYFSFDGYYSLAGYSDIFDVDKYNGEWVSNTDTVVRMEEELLSSPIHDLLGSKEKVYVSPERYWKEVQYIPRGIKIPEEYKGIIE